MITDTHAIIQPRTVMVESFHTSVADGTVAGAWSSQNQAVWAHLTRMNLGEHVEEVVLWSEVAGVFGGGNEEA